MTHSIIDIDGSFGEGGGQILRTALSLSSCLAVPFRIKNIRKNRKKPGLMPQHLTDVKAAAAISGAHVEGARTGSTELLFRPEKSRPGTYRFDIGTAGATTLLLQTLLPPLLFAGAPSSIDLTGGTHVPMSPPFNYIHDIFIPALTMLGVVINVSIEHYGFYPKGGGRILASISPVHALHPLPVDDFVDCPKITLIRGVSGVANLPLSIAERQRTAAARTLDSAGFASAIETISVPSFGQGTFIFLRTDGERCLAGFSATGAKGKPAEKVGEEAARAFLGYAASGACLEPHLADQIALYLAMTKGTSAFTTSSITQHLLTNLQVIERFMTVSYTINGELDRPGKVTITGHGMPLSASV